MGARGPVASGAKRTNSMKVEISADYFPAPDYLTPFAKRYWAEIVESFPTGYFSVADKILLEQFCEMASLRRSASNTIRAEGKKYRDKNGVLRRHPALTDLKQAIESTVLLATKLRITKRSMVTPEVAGRAAHNVTEAAIIQSCSINSLMFDEHARH